MEMKMKSLEILAAEEMAMAKLVEDALRYVDTRFDDGYGFEVLAMCYSGEEMEALIESLDCAHNWPAIKVALDTWAEVKTEACNEARNA